MKLTEMITWYEREISGVGQIRFQAYRYGYGNTRKVLLMGMHGDELSPYLIVSRFLKKIDAINFTIDIVPALNVGGLIAGKRTDVFYNTDYNRNFQILDNMNMIQDIAFSLRKFLHGADFVLDMHNWESPSTIFGLNFNTEGFSDHVFLQTYASLGVRAILDVSGGKEFSGSLGVSLTDIPYFPVEYPSQNFLTEDQVSFFSDRLELTLRGQLTNDYPVLLDRREYLKVPCSGIFNSSVKPGEFIRAGDSVGFIIDPLDKFKIIDFISNIDGYVLYFENKRFIFKNDVAYALGVVCKR